MNNEKLTVTYTSGGENLRVFRFLRSWGGKRKANEAYKNYESDKQHNQDEVCRILNIKMRDPGTDFQFRFKQRDWPEMHFMYYPKIFKDGKSPETPFHKVHKEKK